MGPGTTWASYVGEWRAAVTVPGRPGPVEGRISEWLPVEVRVEVRVVLHTLDARTMAFDRCQGEVRLVHRQGDAVYVVAVSEPNAFDDRHDLRFQAAFRIDAAR